MEQRVTKLETNAERMQADIVELKTDVRELKVDVAHLKQDMSEVKADLSGLRVTHERDFRILFGAIITLGLGLSGLMAKGFGWLH